MALKSTYVQNVLFAQQRVRTAFEFLFPDVPLPDFVTKDRYGTDSLNAKNWNMLANYLAERVATMGEPDFSIVPSDEELEKLNRRELVKYMRGTGLFEKQEDHGTKVELVKRLQEFRDNEEKEEEPENPLDSLDPETGEVPKE